MSSVCNQNRLKSVSLEVKKIIKDYKENRESALRGKNARVIIKDNRFWIVIN